MSKLKRSQLDEYWETVGCSTAEEQLEHLQRLMFDGVSDSLCVACGYVGIEDLEPDAHGCRCFECDDPNSRHAVTEMFMVNPNIVRSLPNQGE